MAKLQKKHVKIGNRKIRYLSGGKGRPLIFLHGWSTSPAAHRQSFDILKKHFTIYAPYLADVRYQKPHLMAKMVLELVRELRLEKVILAGTSFGGVIAALMAVMKPEKISRLMLINTAGMPIRTPTALMLMDSLSSIARLLIEMRFRTLANRLLSVIRFNFNYLKSEVRELALDIRYRTNMSGAFSKIKVSTVVIWSRGDVTYPVPTARDIHRLIQKSKLVIVDGGHAWHYHAPAFFAKVLLRNA